jgi:hypothetical protein
MLARQCQGSPTGLRAAVSRLAGWLVVIGATLTLLVFLGVAATQTLQQANNPMLSLAENALQVRGQSSFAVSQFAKLAGVNAPYGNLEITRCQDSCVIGSCCPVCRAGLIAKSAVFQIRESER